MSSLLYDMIYRTTTTKNNNNNNNGNNTNNNNSNNENNKDRSNNVKATTTSNSTINNNNNNSGNETKIIKKKKKNKTASIRQQQQQEQSIVSRRSRGGGDDDDRRSTTTTTTKTKLSLLLNNNNNDNNNNNNNNNNSTQNTGLTTTFGQQQSNNDNNMDDDDEKYVASSSSSSQGSTSTSSSSSSCSTVSTHDSNEQQQQQQYDIDRIIKVATKRLDYMYNYNNNNNNSNNSNNNTTATTTTTRISNTTTTTTTNDTNDTTTTTKKYSNNNNNNNTDDDHEDYYNNNNKKNLFYQSAWLYYTSGTGAATTTSSSSSSTAAIGATDNNNNNNNNNRKKKKKRKRRHIQDYYSNSMERMIGQLIEKQSTTLSTTSSSVNYNHQQQQQQQQQQPTEKGGGNGTGTTNDNNNNDDENQNNLVLLNQLQLNMLLKDIQIQKIRRNWKRRKYNIGTIDTSQVGAAVTAATTTTTTKNETMYNNNNNNNNNNESEDYNVQHTTIQNHVRAVQEIFPQLLVPKTMTMTPPPTTTMGTRSSSRSDGSNKRRRTDNNNNDNNDPNNNNNNNNNYTIFIKNTMNDDNDKESNKDIIINDNNVLLLPTSIEDDTNMLLSQLTQSNKTLDDYTNTKSYNESMKAKQQQSTAQVLLQNDHWSKLNTMDRGLLLLHQHHQRKQRKQQQQKQRVTFEEGNVDDMMLLDNNNDDDDDNANRLSIPLYRAQKLLLRKQKEEHFIKKKKIMKERGGPTTTINTKQEDEKVSLRDIFIDYDESTNYRSSSSDDDDDDEENTNNNRRIRNTTTTATNSATIRVGIKNENEDNNSNKGIQVKAFPKVEPIGTRRTKYKQQQQQQQQQNIFPLSSQGSFNQISHIQNVHQLAARQIYTSIATSNAPTEFIHRNKEEADDEDIEVEVVRYEQHNRKTDKYKTPWDDDDDDDASYYNDVEYDKSPSYKTTSQNSSSNRNTSMQKKKKYDGDNYNYTYNCDRAIHLLWNASLLEARNIIYKEVKKLYANHPLHSIIKQSSDLGSKVQCFYEHNWTDRTQTMMELGITDASSSNVYGNNNSHYIVKDVVQRLAKRASNTRKPIRIEWVPSNQKIYNKLDMKLPTSRTKDEATVPSIIMKEVQNFYSSLKRFQGCYFNPSITEYRYISGSIPPVPRIFPLDETDIVFGPQHPYHAVAILGCIPESTLKITIAGLCNKLIGCTSNQSLRSSIQTQLLHVMKTAIRLNRKDLHKIHPADEVPILPLFNTGMEFISVVCSGLLEMASTIHNTNVRKQRDEFEKKYIISSMDFDDDENSTMDQNTLPITEKDGIRRFHESIKLFHNYLNDEVIRHHGVRMFTPLRCMFGVIKIASFLPASAAAMLLQPIDKANIRYMTPFDTMRQVLQHLEDSGMIVDSAPQNKDETDDDNSYVQASRLEFELHRAAACFARCVERDPSNIDNICWYLSTVASTMIIASGNKIGAGAHCFASQYALTNQSNRKTRFTVDDDLAETELAPHEIRLALASFHDLRLETLKALKFLLDFGGRNVGVRVHRAILSFLEWSEAVALMIGPIFDEKVEVRTYDNINNLYEHHHTRWCLDESSKASCMEYCGSPVVDPTVRLRVLASMLENEPNRKDHWVEFVAALGPFRATNKSSIRHIGEPDLIPDTIESFGFLGASSPELHRTARKHIQYRITWWGQERCNWWDNFLLQQTMPSKRLPRKLPFTKQKLSTLLSEALAGINVNDVPAYTDSQTGHNRFSTEWIDEAIGRVTYFDVDDRPSLLEREVTIEECLPLSPRKSTSHDLSNTLPSIQLAGDDAETYEMYCYKIMILCHLHGTTMQPGIEKLLILLILKGWTKSGTLLLDSNAFRCLTWLVTMGVDVLKIISHSKSVKD